MSLPVAQPQHPHEDRLVYSDLFMNIFRWVFFSRSLEWKDFHQRTVCFWQKRPVKSANITSNRCPRRVHLALGLWCHFLRDHSECGMRYELVFVLHHIVLDDRSDLHQTSSEMQTHTPRRDESHKHQSRTRTRDEKRSDDDDDDDAGAHLSVCRSGSSGAEGGHGEKEPIDEALHFCDYPAKSACFPSLRSIWSDTVIYLPHPAQIIRGFKLSKWMRLFGISHTHTHVSGVSCATFTYVVLQGRRNEIR